MFDQEIIQDFLTESGELLDRLDRDLVVLESTPTEPELLNGVFRALHTIKGSASFLSLTNLVSVAHAAESALNSARSGSIVLDKGAMDLILGAVDVLKRQFENLKNGEDLVKADDALVEGLLAVAEGRRPSAAPQAAAAHEPPPPAPGPGTGTVLVAAVAETADSFRALSTNSDTGAAIAFSASPPGPTPMVEKSPLRLPDNKQSLIEFLVVDVRESLAQAEAAAAMLPGASTRAAGAGKLAEVGESLGKNADFFEFEQMGGLSASLCKLGAHAGDLGEDLLVQTMPRLHALLELLREQADGLAFGTVIKRPIAGLCNSISQIVEQGTLPPQRTLAPGASPVAALIADGVVPPEESEAASISAEPTDAAQPAATIAAEPRSSTLPTPTIEPEAAQPAEHEHAPTPTPIAHAEPVARAPVPAPEHADPAKAGAGGPAAIEQTIRVEVGRLESLLNLVGELVLQKNRVSAISRTAAAQGLGSHDFLEGFTTAASNLDRVTSDLQVAVMKTRMQPLDKLFGRYPRLIRDLARKTGKEIRLVIEGADTEVDKSVIEELGDPLVHIMRNSADHGVESPEQRRAAGKPEQGTILLRACHEGSHVKVQIIDDGRGLSRQRIGDKAVERGLVTREQLAAMPDNEVRKFIFAAGFSTAEQVTDLSGRGVGMDVVRTNIEKIKGIIELDSIEGKSTVISIKIPLTVAILTAMMVGIGDETYAVPLSSIVEIVKPEAGEGGPLSSIQGAPVMRLRDGVLPLLDGAEVFSLPAKRRKDSPFVVVIQHADRRVGLRVSRLIGQQEVVIKPLDDMAEGAGPVSGATVRDDGGVSLIVDVARMVYLAEQRGRAARPSPAAPLTTARAAAPRR